MNKSIILLLAIILIIGGIYYFESQKAARPRSEENAPIVTVDTMTKEEKAKQYETAKEISTPDGFINTPSTSSGQTPITIGEHIGKKVVLVDFWTYSCINCQRTTPYLNAWYEKYHDKGLEIIGVHTPEFEFEKKYENVEKAVKQFGIKYPVVLDNDYSTWTAYQNRYWPHKYLIDIDGFIVYDHVGEGGYEETERKIQKALAERAQVLGEKEKIVAETTQPKNAEEVDLSTPKSPEIYFGAARNEYLGNGAAQTLGPQTLTAPAAIKPNILYLVGDWNIGVEQAENTSANAKIIFRYQAQKVFFVASSGSGITIKVIKDGTLVKTATVKDSQLYRLIEDTDYGEHTLEIQIENPGLKAFTFTFG